MLVYAVLGLITGSLLNWAGDALPHLAHRFEKAPFAAARLESALGRLIVSAWPGRRTQVSGQGLAVELIGAALFTFIGSQHGWTWNFVVLAGLCTLFILIAVIDLRYRLVLNIVVFPVIAVILAVSVVSPRIDEVTTLVGGAMGFGLFLLAALVRPNGLGGGDVKLAALIGVLFGFPHALWALLLGILAGGLASIILIAVRCWDRRTRIAYAPFLCFGAIVALFFDPLSAVLH
ncbi:MAG TPA: A24 family peptidase [Anaerolineae bacterium]